MSNLGGWAGPGLLLWAQWRFPLLSEHGWPAYLLKCPPCPVPPGPAWPALPVERVLSPGGWTKEANLRHRRVRVWEWRVGRAEAGVGGGGRRNTALSSREEFPGLVGVAVCALCAQLSAKCWKMLRRGQGSCPAGTPPWLKDGSGR